MKDNQQPIRDGDSFEEHLAGSDKTALIVTEKLYFERNLTMRHDSSMKICNARWKTSKKRDSHDVINRSS